MIVVLNGPLGIGKSTPAEALSESIEMCVSIDGDQVVAANPPAPDGLEHLHSTIALLVEHHRRFGYRHFVINHFWRSATEPADLRSRLNADPEFHCFLLTLPEEENRRRIQRRASTRAIDEREFEQKTFAEEYRMLGAAASSDVGEPFDVLAPPFELVEAMLRRLGARQPPNMRSQPIGLEGAPSG
jgi:thymidylate kinase